MPMKILQWKSPYEILHGVKPTYDHLRTIGCLCYANVNKPNKDKFEDRGLRCIFIGYPPAQRGYKLYCLDLHEVICSRDVVFKEDIFPFKILQKENKPAQQQSVFPIMCDSIEDDDNPPNVPTSDHLSATQETAILEPITNIQESDIQPSQISQPQIRRSTRNTSQPVRLQDYVQPHKKDISSATTNCATRCIYPLFKQEDFDAYSADYVASIFHVLNTVEPTSYNQAKIHPE
ncbi:uncharacterized protein [Rutidosis leptorrhynchoides]|uniref:uncharacterized protein n=1 Tax=Rutidosis leptorrhynchoides TaxID=125765 RepID=UPI003A99B95F